MSATAKRRFRGLLLVSMGVAACRTDRRDAGTPTVTARDSAGVWVVENEVPVDGVPEYAELGAMELEIGVVDGDPAYSFTTIAGVNTLGDGGVVVAEWQTREIRIFDGNGRHVRTLGGFGDGPGEFSQIVNVAGVRGDTIRVWDIRQQRITTMSSDGTLLGSFRLERGQAASGFGPVTHLADGTYLVPLRDLGDLDMESTSGRATQVLLRASAHGEIFDTMAMLAGEEMTVVRGQRAATILPTPAGRKPLWATGTDRVYTAWNGEYRIVARTLAGDPAMVILAPGLGRPLERGAFDAAKRAWLDECPDERCRRWYARIFEVVEPPDAWPAFSDLRVDALGDLWVAEYELQAAAPSAWHVFSARGELLGHVAVPAGLEIHEIGEDYLLGVEENELDVPFVRRYALMRLR
ncbi:MAG: hypothetical protein PVF69_07575 [Gemmatimonadota bacterium]|jgi:hypothetical protein